MTVNAGVGVPVELLPEGSADAVERDRIDARVHVGQTESDYPRVVPEAVVVLLRVRVGKVEPEHEQVVREEAQGEHDDERQDRHRNFLPHADL